MKTYEHKVKIINGVTHWNTAKLESYLELAYNSLHVQHSYFKKTGKSKHKIIFDGRKKIDGVVWYSLGKIIEWEMEQSHIQDLIHDASLFLDEMKNKYGTTKLAKLYGVSTERIHQWRKRNLGIQSAERILALKGTENG